MAQRSDIRHTHKHRRTVVVQEQAPPPLPLSSTFVSYISHTHRISSDTPIGTVIINYLITTHTEPTANVVGIDKSGSYFSLYGYDPFTPVGETSINHLSVSKTSFGNSEDKIAALESLIYFLESIDGKPYEDLELLDKAVRELNVTMSKLVPVQQVRQTTVQGGVRDSIPYNAPVGLHQSIEYVDEDTTSSSEDGPIVRRQSIRTPATVVPIPVRQQVVLTSTSPRVRQNTPVAQIASGNQMTRRIVNGVSPVVRDVW